MNDIGKLAGWFAFVSIPIGIIAALLTGNSVYFAASFLMMAGFLILAMIMSVDENDWDD